MIEFSKKFRSKQSEIMDDFELQGPEMKELMNDLRKVNKWLGGNKITLNAVSYLLEGHSKEKEITIIDLGCGDGEMLRQCATYGAMHGYKFKFIGIDFNPNILKEAIKKSESFSNISFLKTDVFSEGNSLPNCDIALATLFLHHFSNKKIELLVKQLSEKATIGVVVNDLERSRSAFVLFKVASEIFLKTKVARHDGLVSIARGFKKEELTLISKKIPNQHSSIQWRWAFRYKWILKKNI